MIAKENNKESQSTIKFGVIFVVVVDDFYSTDFSWFGQWMRHNYVEMNINLVEDLNKELSVEELEIQKAYFG